MSKVWDCFTYFNEEEVLRIRLEELNNVVDHFIIVEADCTFTGKSKSMYLDEVLNKEWIQPFEDKICRARMGLMYSAMNVAATPWRLETQQRNKIKDALKLYEAKEDDIVIISDVDEIPKADMVHRLESPTQLDVTQYFWGPNWQVPQHCNQGGRPVIAKKKDITTPQEMRCANDLPRICDAGWHFSFFTAAKDVQKKIEAFSHTEYDLPEFKDVQKIKERIEKGIDPFDRFSLKWTEIDNTFPKYIQENYK